MKRKSLVIVETSPVITEGVQALFGDNTEFKVTKTYPSGALGPNIILSGIDILIIDPRSISEVQLSKFIHDCREEHEELVVIALQTSYISSALLSIFDNVIEMDDTSSAIITKLRNTNKKGNYADGYDNNELSTREKEVLVLVAKGKTNKEIADELNISIHTVIAHRKNITGKTNIKSISGLTIYALLNNLISQDEVK